MSRNQSLVTEVFKESLKKKRDPVQEVIEKIIGAQKQAKPDIEETLAKAAEAIRLHKQLSRRKSYI